MQLVRRQVEIRTKALIKGKNSIRAVSTALVLSLCGCQSAKVASSHANYSDVNSFSGQLYLQYGELAFRKEAEGNAAAAAHFNEKAKRAAGGNIVPPDRASDAEAMPEYERVQQAVGNDSTPPAVRARVQVMYDCWLDERSENVDPGDIRACRQELDRAMAILDGGKRAAGAGSG